MRPGPEWVYRSRQRRHHRALLALGSASLSATPLGRLAPAIKDNEIRVEYMGASARRAVHVKYVIAAVLAASAARSRRPPWGTSIRRWRSGRHRRVHLHHDPRRYRPRARAVRRRADLRCDPHHGLRSLAQHLADEPGPRAPAHHRVPARGALVMFKALCPSFLTRGAEQVLRRGDRGEGRQRRDREGFGGGPDRHQRRRQDHVHQHDHRLSSPTPAASSTKDATSPRCAARYHAPGHLPLVPDSAALQLAQRVRQHDDGPGHRAGQRRPRRLFSRGEARCRATASWRRGGGGASARALRAPTTATATRRCCPAGCASARHRAHHGGQAARAAAGRAHQRRLRAEVRHHADGARRGARRGARCCSSSTTWRW